MKEYKMHIKCLLNIDLSSPLSNYMEYPYVYLPSVSTCTSPLISVHLLVALLLWWGPKWNKHPVQGRRAGQWQNPGLCGLCFLILLVSPSLSALLCVSSTWVGWLIFLSVGFYILCPQLALLSSPDSLSFFLTVFGVERRDAYLLWLCWPNDLKKSIGDLKIKWHKKKKPNKLSQLAFKWGVAQIVFFSFKVFSIFSF